MMSQPDRRVNGRPSTGCESCRRRKIKASQLRKASASIFTDFQFAYKVRSVMRGSQSVRNVSRGDSNVGIEIKSISGSAIRRRKLPREDGGEQRLHRELKVYREGGRVTR